MGMKAALDAADKTVIMCQIESAGGLANAPAIAGVPGVDALFIVRADLALAMGHEDMRVAAVTEATHAIIAAARAAGRSLRCSCPTWPSASSSQPPAPLVSWWAPINR